MLAPLRAENETRTRDPDLGKVVLYQLSYFRIIDTRFGESGLQSYDFFSFLQNFFRFFADLLTISGHNGP